MKDKITQEMKLTKQEAIEADLQKRREGRQRWIELLKTENSIKILKEPFYV